MTSTPTAVVSRGTGCPCYRCERHRWTERARRRRRAARARAASTGEPYVEPRRETPAERRAAEIAWLERRARRAAREAEQLLEEAALDPPTL